MYIEPNSTPKVSVVVVSYNTKEKLHRCLECLEPHLEVIVVDNASKDGSPQMVAADFPRVKLIANQENRGFGTANNQGLDVASGELTLFLNSDAYADPGAVDKLSAVFRDPGVIAAGGRLLNPDRTLQQSSANELTLWAVFCEQTLLEKIFPNSGLFSPYWNSRQFTDASETAQVMGACLMIRPVERFDERFFLYCEDTELCYRLRKHGRILYVPDALFVHELGSSSSGTRWESVARYNIGKELYFRIHHGAVASWLCWAMNKLGALLRLAIWSVASLLTLGTRKTYIRKAGLFARVLFA